MSTVTNTAEPQLRVSPLARRLAREAKLDPASLTGSGPLGRIIAEDVRSAVAHNISRPHISQSQISRQKPATKSAIDPLSAKALADALERSYTLKPMSAVRRVIASRLSESKQRIPHYYLNANCRVDALTRLRAEINKQAEGAYKLSINDFIVRAMALALRDVPQANCAFDEEGIVYWQSVDLSIAVATEDGLFTPVVHNADTLSLPELSSTIGTLAKKARSGTLKPQEYLGGSFSVSNLGMFGVSDFSAVINPPQCGILAVGAAENSAVVSKSGQLEVGQILRLTFSLDHRAIDGALGAQLLARLRNHLENPLLLALTPPPTPPTPSP
ncbi:MAG: 2-oxo acid dehydrogenase subunit E2 [Alphaproteobacteria bacterium]